MACNSRYLYLTHFSKVTDTDRLADDMHRGIDDFVEITERHVADNERSARMQESMFNYFVERLDEHGFAGGTERAHAVLDFDVWINTMGLESWLDRKRQ